MLEKVKPSSNSIGIGPTGATGPQGPTGPTGPQGPASPLNMLDLIEQSSDPAAPASGTRRSWVDSAGKLRSLVGSSNQAWLFYAGAVVRVTLDLGGVVLRGTAGEELDVGGGDITLNAGGSSLGLFANGQVQLSPAGALLLFGLPTADPHVVGQLYDAPVTHAVTISQG